MPEPIFPPLAIVSYVACVAGAAALANCAVLAALLKTHKSGLLSIIMQLATIDFVLLGGTAGLELWSLNAQTWPFGKVGCMVYRGLDVLTSTSSSYLIVMIVLHTLASINLEEKANERRAKRNCDEDEIRSSRHSLVANSDSSTPPRTMNIDYRIVNTRVPVIPPSIFVWVLATSLSVPEFVLATTVRQYNNSEICTFIEPSHRINMHSMLAVFNLFLPCAMLCTIGTLAVIKLKSKSTIQLEDELKSALKLSLWLIVTYVLLCLPRSILASYMVYTTPAADETAPLQDAEAALAKLSIATTCAYILASLLRPMLCMYLLPRLRWVFMSHTRMDEIDDV